MANILIVEDEAITAIDLKNQLTRSGYNIEGIVSNGAEAIIKSLQLKPDLILMDIVLKGEIDGIEAAKRINRVLDIPIIYLTAYSEEKIFEKVKYTKPYAYILKPFKEKEVKYAIEIALHKHKLDLKQNKDKEKELKQSLAKKEMLLKEIKNHLEEEYENTSSLINQSSKNNKLEKESLYQDRLTEPSFALVDFQLYIDSLIKDLLSSYSIKSDNITLKLNIEKIMLDMETSLSFGLIINEIIKNLIENAIFIGKRSEIFINFSMIDGKAIFAINNEFIKSYEDLKLDNITLNTLVKQFRGKIKFDNENAELKVVFENL